MTTHDTCVCVVRDSHETCVCVCVWRERQKARLSPRRLCSPSWLLIFTQQCVCVCTRARARACVWGEGACRRYRGLSETGLGVGSIRAVSRVRAALRVGATPPWLPDAERVRERARERASERVCSPRQITSTLHEATALTCQQSMPVKQPSRLALPEAIASERVCVCVGGSVWETERRCVRVCARLTRSHRQHVSPVCPGRRSLQQSTPTPIPPRVSTPTSDAEAHKELEMGH